MAETIETKYRLTIHTSGGYGDIHVDGEYGIENVESAVVRSMDGGWLLVDERGVSFAVNPANIIAIEYAEVSA